VARLLGWPMLPLERCRCSVERSATQLDCPTGATVPVRCRPKRGRDRQTGKEQVDQSPWSQILGLARHARRQLQSLPDRARRKRLARKPQQAAAAWPSGTSMVAATPGYHPATRLCRARPTAPTARGPEREGHRDFVVERGPGRVRTGINQGTLAANAPVASPGRSGAWRRRREPSGRGIKAEGRQSEQENKKGGTRPPLLLCRSVDQRHSRRILRR
jgi:hypothetical protein